MTKLALTLAIFVAAQFGSATACKEGFVYCLYGQKCIPSESFCDGNVDCPFGTDENNCASARSSRFRSFASIVPRFNVPRIASKPVGKPAVVAKNQVWKSDVVAEEDYRSYDCGKVMTMASGRVSDGDISKPYQFPWAVRLHMVSYDTTTREEVPYKCGATLVAPEWILTAAHCLPDSTDQNKWSFSAMLGENDFSNTESSTRVDRRLEGPVVKHPLYVNNGFYDFALAKIAKVPYSAAIQPICLPTSDMCTEDEVKSDGVQINFCQYTAAVAGWGWSKIPNSEAKLQNVTLPLQKTSACGAAFGDETVCAGDLVKDACAGDSGSALFCNAGKRKRTYQLAIVRAGPDCTYSTEPKSHYGIYSRVCHVLEWIHKTIEDNSN